MKQFVGLFTIHIFNLMAASKLSELASSADECSWYFITYLMDVVFTTFFSFITMKFLDDYFSKKGLDYLVAGNYFKGLKVSISYWLQQVLIWLATIVLVILL